MTTTTRRMIESEIRTLETTEVLVETNSGTYGPAEAVRKARCADPAFADYRIYETPAGARRHVGCDPERAPGRARRIGADEMRDLKRRIAELQRRLREQN